MFDETPDRSSFAQTIFWRNLGWEDGTLHEEMVLSRLRQRATQYAKPLIDDDNAPTTSIVIFRLGDETYGIDAPLVYAIRRIGAIATVPNIPDFYIGVVNVRGQIITVFDLRRFFGKHDAHDTKMPNELLVVRANGLELGILAHMVEDVVTLKLSEIQPLNDTTYSWGITRQKVILLDMARLFTDARLIVGTPEITT